MKFPSVHDVGEYRPHPAPRPLLRVRLVQRRAEFRKRGAMGVEFRVAVERGSCSNSGGRSSSGVLSSGGGERSRDAIDIDQNLRETYTISVENSGRQNGFERILVEPSLLKALVQIIGI